MTRDVPETAVEILGKTYHIKCPESELSALRRSAEYLEEKMFALREAGVLSFDKLSIITALNVVHQLLTFEQQKNHSLQTINQRLIDLHGKIELSLAQTAQMELQSTD